MLKFHQRLLFLLCTIVIISFLALGAIITHAIYNTVSSAQEGDLEHQADHLVKLYKNDKENEMTDIAKSEKLTVKIEESNDVLFSTNQGTQINEDIKNEANPSSLPRPMVAQRAAPAAIARCRDAASACGSSASSVGQPARWRSAR